MYYKIVLTEVTGQKLCVLGAIRTMFSMRLIEAKRAVLTLPAHLEGGLTREECEKLREQIVQQGGSAEILEDPDATAHTEGFVTVQCPECGYACLKHAYYPDWGDTPPFGFTNETMHSCYRCNFLFRKAYPKP